MSNEDVLEQCIDFINRTIESIAPNEVWHIRIDTNQVPDAGYEISRLHAHNGDDCLTMVKISHHELANPEFATILRHKLKLAEPSFRWPKMSDERTLG